MNFRKADLAPPSVDDPALFAVLGAQFLDAARLLPLGFFADRRRLGRRGRRLRRAGWRRRRRPGRGRPRPPGLAQIDVRGAARRWARVGFGRRERQARDAVDLVFQDIGHAGVSSERHVEQIACDRDAAHHRVDAQQHRHAGHALLRGARPRRLGEEEGAGAQPVSVSDSRDPSQDAVQSDLQRADLEKAVGDAPPIVYVLADRLQFGRSRRHVRPTFSRPLGRHRRRVQRA